MISRLPVVVLISFLLTLNVYQYLSSAEIKKELVKKTEQKAECEAALTLQNQGIEEYKMDIVTAKIKYEDEIKKLQSRIDTKRGQSHDKNLENVVTDIIDDFYR